MSSSTTSGAYTYRNEPKRHWAVTYHATPANIAELAAGEADAQELARRARAQFDQAVNAWRERAGPALLGVAGQLERCPTTGAFHWQLHVRTQPVRRTQLYSWMRHDEAAGGASAEPARNLSALEAYVRKEDTRAAGPFEWPDAARATGGQGMRSDVMDLIDAIKEGKTNEELLMTHTNQAMRHYRNINALRQDLKVFKPRDVLNPPQVYLYWGDSGSGKTKAAWEMGTNPDQIYIKGPGKWWDGYTQQAICILDDFNGKFFGLTQKEDMCWLLRILDRYPVKVEVKGATIDFNSNVIIITSNQRYEDWYPETFAAEPHFLLAVKRRFTGIQHFTKGPFSGL